VARRHGQLRVGYANTYIRCEDEASIAAILKDKRLESLRLRQIAPTVLISESESGDSLEELRSSGYLPSMESQSGDVISLPRQLRAQSKARLPRVISETSEPTPTVIAAAVKVLRAGDRAHSFTASRAEIPRTSANETLAILRKSIESESTITIGYADTNGGVTQRIVDPVSIAMGNLIARDHGNDEVITFKIARITGVAFIDG
jgi:predicted DNA-binding transcriptional regulator YafY